MQHFTLSGLQKRLDEHVNYVKTYRERMARALTVDSEMFDYTVQTFARSLAEHEALAEAYKVAVRVAQGGDLETVNYANQLLANQAFRWVVAPRPADVWAAAIAEAQRSAGKFILAEMQLLTTLVDPEYLD